MYPGWKGHHLPTQPWLGYLLIEMGVWLCQCGMPFAIYASVSASFQVLSSLRNLHSTGRGALVVPCECASTMQHHTVSEVDHPLGVAYLWICMLPWLGILHVLSTNT